MHYYSFVDVIIMKDFVNINEIMITNHQIIMTT